MIETASLGFVSILLPTAVLFTLYSVVAAVRYHTTGWDPETTFETDISYASTMEGHAIRTGEVIISVTVFFVLMYTLGFFVSIFLL